MDTSFLEKLQNEIDIKIKLISETYMGGGLNDMEHHKYLQGQLEALYYIQDFIKNYFKVHND
jgi:hypothetical protein|tara:strand:- start:793 stop:978 length:186 start_codon:yes stop_codon:yes gene_type:complete